MIINGIEHYSISDIKAINAERGQHYFERSTMRFFNSRVERTVYNGPGGHYFVTSEQFVPSESPAHARRYTVRRFMPETGDIETVGEFNKLSLSEARLVARAAARAPRAEAA